MELPPPAEPPKSPAGWAGLGVGLAAAAGAAVGAAAWEGWRWLDERAVARDPEHAVLSDPPRGEPFEVRTADGVRLAGELFGPADAPPVVLIHGWTCARRFWTYQLNALAREHRVIAYDLRGHGQSSAHDACDFSTDALADDVQAVLEATVPAGRRVVLVGHSLGGMSIVAWAGRHPAQVGERAAAVALINLGIGDLVSESLVVRMPGRLGAIKSALGRALLSADQQLPPATPISRRLVRYIALSESASPAQVELTQQLVLGCRRQVRSGCGRTLSRLDLRHAIERLQVPTLVLAGERDRLTPPAHAQRLAATLPQLHEHVEVPRVGHMSPLEAPHEVNAALDRLLARVRESAAA